MAQEDTIVAIATPIGRSGVGVVRMSGPDSLKIAKKLVKIKNLSHKKAINTWIKLPNGKPLDNVIILYMKGPQSYTGEDVVEISAHGSPPILQKIVMLAIQKGARLAEPGEYTKRAFLNGKLDLAQAEAVFDLIHAKTPEASAMAAEQLGGEVSAKAKSLRGGLLNLLARIEAAIDFPDDVVEPGGKEAAGAVNKALKEIEQMLLDAEYSRVFKEGLSTVIIGRPNVGKSSLLNALLKDQRAIVTSQPGTTRDVLEEEISLCGLPVKIIDTAGIRRPKDRAEKLSIERTKSEIEKAEMIIAMLDGSLKISKEDLETLRLIRGKRAIIVINKIDKKQNRTISRLKNRYQGKMVKRISALTGKGIKGLEGAIYRAYSRHAGKRTRTVANLRHKECMLRAKDALQNMLNSYRMKMTLEIKASELKRAVVALGEISGEAVSEEAISEIFSKFCVGK